jgi:hypothetical protein
VRRFGPPPLLSESSIARLALLIEPPNFCGFDCFLIATPLLFIGQAIGLDLMNALLNECARQRREPAIAVTVKIRLQHRWVGAILHGRPEFYFNLLLQGSLTA